jgi:hypothetical protein
MATQSLPIPSAKTREHIQSRVIARVPSMRIVTIVFGTLLILLFWLHFILVMDTISTNRQIQIGLQELEQEKRAQEAARRAIGIAGSQQSMQIRAEQWEYGNGEQLYLIVPQALSQPSGAVPDGEAPAPTTTTGESSPIQASLGEVVIGDSESWLESETKP